MIRRCENPSHKSYKDYGARGIKVCDRWKSFDAFFSDMGKAPAGLSIDRIDTNGNYEPGNCRWTTQKVQQNNRRSNRVLSAFGREQTMQRWAEEFSITADAISKRLEGGWNAERAVTQPMKADKRRSA
jgi:hypothetical protein